MRPQFALVSDDELNYLETYARDCYTGVGKIVDLGTWLGGTAGALARGLRSNPIQSRFFRPIESYDQFLWQPWMTPLAQGLGMTPEFQDGDSFLPYTENAIGDLLDLIELRQVDLSLEQVVLEPIEFLMVDAMKSWPLANAISKSFFPKLIPGLALVVQQDFGYHHPITATNHILMWILRDWFVPVHQVPNSTSCVFLLAKEIRSYDIPVMDPKALTPEAINAAWQYSLSFTLPHSISEIQLCKKLFLEELKQ